jgi:hypothetical protein
MTISDHARQNGSLSHRERVRVRGTIRNIHIQKRHRKNDIPT